MGGASSEIRETTREILIESATFDPTAVRKTAQRHGLRTESSSRYERGLPLELAPLGLARALQLLTEHAGASKPETIVDVVNTPSKVRSVKLRPKHVENLLGMSVKDNIIVQHLERLGFGVQASKDELTVAVPWWRADVKIAEDLIEEVGRSIGYDDLTPTLPQWRPKNIEFDSRWARQWQLKAALRSLGLFEVVTYSFVSQQLLTDFGYKLGEHLKLKNPLSSEQAYLRSSLMPSLVATVGKNAKYSKDFGLVELSKVYEAGTNHKKQPQEPYHVGIVRRTGYKGVKVALDLISQVFGVDLEVLPKQQLALHPLRSAEVILNREVVGRIGEVHPDITAKYKISGDLGYLELDLAPIFAAAGSKKPQEISKFPSISRDLAIVVPDVVMWKQAKHIIAGLDLCQAKFLNDYHGPDLPAGTKSMAIRLTFSSMERTLTDKEADTGAATVLKALEKTLEAKERS
jgi:phenylalanyl-tRNA synthetase beta chain